MNRSFRSLSCVHWMVLILALAVPAGAILAVQPPTAGLVAWYRFDGNTLDSSGNGYNGTAYNGAAPAADRYGNPSGAYSFNGSNSYVQIPDSSAFDFAGSPFTIAAWVKLSGAFSGSAGFGSIFDRSHTGYSEGYRLDYSTTSHTLRLIGSPGLQVPALLVPGTWYHVVAVSDGTGSATIYLDGFALGTDSYATLAYAAPPRIGDCQATGNAPWNGSIDDVLIYNRALTPDEVRELYGVFSFQDDYGRSQLCCDTTIGTWQWTVLKGNGAGQSFSGPGTVVNGSGYMRLTAAPGSGYGLNLIYYTTAHRATATFTYRPDAVSSALYDSNTLDDPPACGECLNLTNPGFETGDLTGWTASGSYLPIVQNSVVHTGNYAAKLGSAGSDTAYKVSILYKTVTIPASGRYSLGVWYWAFGVAQDSFQLAYVADSSGNRLATIFLLFSNNPQWDYASFDLTPYAGQTIRLVFEVNEGDRSGAGMYVDDLSICPQSLPGTSASGTTAGGRHSR